MGNVRGDVGREAGGEFAQKYRDDDIVRALVEAFPEPMSAVEVGEAVGAPRTSAHFRLQKIVTDTGGEDEGIVRTKKVGARARVYWLSDPEAARAAVERGDDGESGD